MSACNYTTYTVHTAFNIVCTQRGEARPHLHFLRGTPFLASYARFHYVTDARPLTPLPDAQRCAAPVMARALGNSIGWGSFPHWND